MKKITLTTVFCLFITYAFAQEPTTAHTKVVEIMKSEFNYTYDSTNNKTAQATNATPKKENNNKGGLMVCYSKIFHSPLVVLDGNPVNMEDLYSYAMEDIVNIKIYSDPVAIVAAYYGARASKGVIYVNTKEGDFISLPDSLATKIIRY